MNQVENQERIAKLIALHLTGDINEAEQALLTQWVNSSEHNTQLFNRITDAASLAEALQELQNTDTESGLANVRQRIADERDKQARPIIRLWPRIAAAASILLFLSIGGYFLLHKPATSQIALLKPGTYKNDALPGNKAFITLANGKQIAVSASLKGQLAIQGSTSIQKSANGDVVYKPGNANEDVAYNTFTVPRGGGKHEIQLADGTLAVLDAASSIRFPVAFNGKDRRVSITGQVYFEVVHNDKQPFYVTANNQTIEDIGTHFNINSFEGDTKTTLIEGSVKVNNVLLKPGQQAIGKPDGSVNVLNGVDEEVVMAWKNDLFKFSKNASLQTVMNQIGRWYDMDVVYQGSSKIYHFGGDMPRYSKLSDVLKILAYNGVQFSVDGKKIIVYQ
jgi:transmembrane sensor